MVVALAALGCAELRPGRCNVDGDCARGLVCSQDFVAGVYHRCVAPNDGSADAADTGRLDAADAGGDGHPDGEVGAPGDAGADADASVDVPPPTCLTQGCPDSAAPVCDPDTVACVQCLNSTTDCTAPKPVCDTTAKSCVGCLASTDCTAPKPVCDTTAKSCVGCLVSATDCGGTKPICDTQDCRACKSDSECVTALGADPGLCMPDGHCASGAEVVYAIQPTTSNCGTADGTLAKPYCTAQAAVDAARMGTQRIVLFRGAFGNVVATSTPAQLTLIGQRGALINPGANIYGFDVSGTASVFVRDLTITGGTSSTGAAAHVGGVSATLNLVNIQISGNAGSGVVADGGGLIVMDRCVVKGGGGLAPPSLKTTASPFHITNSVFASSSIGASLDAAPSGGDQTFKNNTIVANGSGTICTGSIQIAGSLFSGNTNDSIGCTVASCCGPGDPMLTADYHLMAGSPCIDQLTPDPMITHDIDGDPRPIGLKSDCGADEFRAP